MNPDDPTTPDTALCELCGEWKPRDEMHELDGDLGVFEVCDDCAAVPF